MFKLYLNFFTLKKNIYIEAIALAMKKNSILSNNYCGVYISGTTFLTCTRGKLFPPPEGLISATYFRRPTVAIGVFLTIPYCQE